MAKLNWSRKPTPEPWRGGLTHKPVSWLKRQSAISKRAKQAAKDPNFVLFRDKDYKKNYEKIHGRGSLARDRLAYAQKCAQ